MRYLPHTDADVARMLRVIGAPSVEALFAHIPASLRTKRPLELGPPLDEQALLAHFQELGARGRPSNGPGQLSFLGAGLTPHVVPAAVDALLGRTEWYTAYTPYQPEISQGTLQAIFEYQTIAAEILGLDVANASMYDGASATAEAILMSRRVNGRRRALLSGGLHPHYREVAATYHNCLPDTLTTLPLDGASGKTPAKAASQALDDDIACLVVQSPNYFGVVEDLPALAEAAHAAGALLVVVTTEPLAYGVLKSPGTLGADIAVAEGLGLAGEPSLGGPGLGLFATRTAHARSMPGRLIGETVDHDGRRGYVLTLATREQHIRREKATSNICSNEGLVALAFTIHLALLGRSGWHELATLNLARAEHAKRTLTSLTGFSLAFSGPTFNEFALRIRGGDARRVVERLADRGIFPGAAVRSPGTQAKAPEDLLLLAVSERHSPADIERLAASLDEVCP